ncbi:MAG: hypothetical protein ACODAJ_09185, partial [Planctomycetota bacterium]
MRRYRCCPMFVLGLALAVSAFAGQAAEAPTDLAILTQALARPLAALQGRQAVFTVTLDGRYEDGETEETGKVTIARAADGAFGLSLDSRLLTFRVLRDAKATRLVVPTKRVAIVGRGPVPKESDFEPRRLFPNVVAGLPPQVQAVVSLLSTAEPSAVALLLQQLAQLQRAPHEAEQDAPIVFVAKRPMGKGTLTVELEPDASLPGVRVTAR